MCAAVGKIDVDWDVNYFNNDYFLVFWINENETTDNTLKLRCTVVHLGAELNLQKTNYRSSVL